MAPPPPRPNRPRLLARARAPSCLLLLLAGARPAGALSNLPGPAGPHVVARERHEVPNNGTASWVLAPAGPAPPGGFPGVVFAHGLCSEPLVYRDLLENLASHGVVVIANDEQTTLEGQINRLVTRINSSVRSQAGRVDFEDPIQYMQSQNMSVEQIYALLCVADVLVVTPMRDGMNTTPFEYVVCREVRGEVGTVVLSEFTGCARRLAGALLVNPWDTSAFSNSLRDSLGLRKAQLQSTLRHGPNGMHDAGMHAVAAMPAPMAVFGSSNVSSSPSFLSKTPPLKKAEREEVL